MKKAAATTAAAHVRNSSADIVVVITQHKTHIYRSHQVGGLVELMAAA